jgi:replicative DNA helicase
MSATVDLALVPGAGMPDATNPECALLGGVFLDPEKIWEVCHIVNGDDFARAAHRHVFSAMLALSQRSDSIEVVTVTEELTQAGRLNEAGGQAYVLALESIVPPSGNAVRYAKMVADAAAKRRLVQAAQSIVADARSGEGTVDALLDRSGQRILDATQRQAETAPVPLRELVPSAFKRLEQRFEKQQEITGLATGLERLDKKTAGFQPGDLVIIAGRPSMGKTTVAMQFAEHAAIDLKEPTLVFSLEMSKEKLTDRMLSSRARVSALRIKTGMLLDSDWAKLARAADELHKAPLEILDAGGLKVLRVRQECRKFKARHKKLGLVVVDYLQLMEGNGEEDNREQAISSISRGLKSIAKEMGCVVVALAQLNRSLERREDRRPMMSDLRESGAIEQDADVIAFVYRDEVYNKESPDKGVAELIVGKQRDGEIGTAHVAFMGEYVRFENLADDRYSVRH